MNILFQGKVMRNKRLAIQISCSYEPNRLAEQCLSDAYEKVVSKEITQPLSAESRKVGYSAGSAVRS
ncbi:hypothetical protein [Wolbachia endosymbiont (group B) of Horisme vitalbata]|uniref:hypothetical protein n=1 Tax=Wolbachia endosymbiont (group B) of Horisme vitalbata TaxID=3066178 RepID=UPI00334076AE